MTVEQLIERLVALGPRCAKYIIDVRISVGDLGDYQVDDLAEMADSRSDGTGWLTFFLDERPQ